VAKSVLSEVRNSTKISDSILKRDS